MSTQPVYFNPINYPLTNYSGLESQQKSGLCFQDCDVHNGSVSELEPNSNYSNVNKNSFNTKSLEKLAYKTHQVIVGANISLDSSEPKYLGAFDETTANSQSVLKQTSLNDDTDCLRESNKRKRESSAQARISQKRPKGWIFHTANPAVKKNLKKPSNFQDVGDAPNSKSESDEYTLRRKEILATGQLLKDNSMLVKKGSTACIETVASMHNGYLRLREKLLKKNILGLDPDSENKNYIFKDEYIFRTPSLAASVISGANASGSDYWKNRSNQSIKAVELKKKNS